MEMHVPPELLIPELKKEIERLKQELAKVHAEHVHSYALFKSNVKEHNDVEQKLPKESQESDNNLQENWEKYKILFDSIDEGFCVIEMRIEHGKPLDYRFLEVNQAFEKQSTLVDAKGKWMRELRPEHEEKWFEIYRDVALTGKPVRFEMSERALDNRWFTLYAFRIGTPEQRRVAVLFNDITKTKQTEEALRLSEEKFSAAFKSNPNALVLSLVNDGTIIDVNDTFLSLFERTKEEVIGKTSSSLNMFANTEDRNKAIAIIRRDGRVVNYEIKIKRRNGEERISLLSVEILHVARGKIMLTTIQDITDQKKSEARIQELLKLSERRSAELNAIIESIPDAIYIGNSKGITQCNIPALKMLGASSLQDLQNRIGELGAKFNVRWPDSGRKLHEDELQFSRALKGETIIEEVLATNAQTGEDIYIRSADAPIIVNDEIVGAVAVNSDMTERRKSQKVLLQSQERLKAIFDNLTEGLIIVDPIERSLEWNPAALSMHGYNHIENKLDFLAKVGEIFEPTTTDGELLSFEQWPINRMIRGENFQNYPMYLRNKEQGWKKLISYSGTLILDSKGNPFLGFLSLRDITEMKEAEDALRKSREELKSITDNSPDVIARFDRQMRHIFINPYGEKVYGKKQDEIIGKSSAELGMSADKVAFWKKHFEETIETGKQQSLEFGFESTTIGYQFFHSTFVPEKNYAGDIISVLAISRDITDLKSSEEALRLREAQLDGFFANSPAILNLVDENFCYINTDRLTPTYYGLNRETIKGRCVQDLSPDFIKQTGGVMRRVLETGEPLLDALFESPVPGRSGEMAYWRSSFFRVPLGNEKWGVGVISVEVTDIKRSEKKLYESEDRFHTLADNISQFAWMADVSGSIFWYNKRWYDYTGTNFEDMKGWGWIKVHHPDHVDRVIEKFKKAIDTGDNWEDTFPMRGKDNSYRWYLSRALPIRDENNNIIRWFGTNTDITEQKLAEEKLHAALLQAEEGRNTLTALMEYIPLGITIANAPDVNIRMVSKYGQEILEKPSDEIAGIPAPEHPSKWGIYKADGITPGLPEELPLSRATLKGEIVKNEEWFVTRKDGTLVPILCNAAPILNNIGNVVGGIIGWQDIADLKKIEQEMRLRNEELTRFIYTVSHDLKSPLVTIKMFTTYLKDDIKNDDKENQQKDLRYIENATDKMGRLLDELLELSRIGRKEQFKTEILLETIVWNAIDLVAGRIREKNIDVVITAPPILLFGFHLRLIQLFQNLLDNAAKFMGNQPEPSVEIGAFTEKNNDVVLFVKDNGSGIDPRYHNKLFGLFEKLDPATEGTGIGLALVKRIVEVHQGRIWFTSEGLGKGTTFYFTLEKTKILNR